LYLDYEGSPCEADDQFEAYERAVMEKLSKTVTDFRFNALEHCHKNNFAPIMVAMQNVEKFMFARGFIYLEKSNLDVMKLEALNFNFMADLKYLKIRYYHDDIFKLVRQSRNLDTFVYSCKGNLLANRWEELLNFLAQQKKLEHLKLFNHYSFNFVMEDWPMMPFKLKSFRIDDPNLKEASFEFLTQQDQLEFLAVPASLNNLRQFHIELKMFLAMPKLKKLELKFIFFRFNGTFPDWFLENLQNKTIKTLIIRSCPMNILLPIINLCQAVEKIILYDREFYDLSEMSWNVINKIHAHAYHWPHIKMFYAPPNIPNSDQLESNIIDCFEKGRWKGIHLLRIGSTKWRENHPNFQLSFQFCKYLIDLVEMADLIIQKLELFNVHDCDELRAYLDKLKPLTLDNIKLHYKAMMPVDNK